MASREGIGITSLGLTIHFALPIDCHISTAVPLRPATGSAPDSVIVEVDPAVQSGTLGRILIVTVTTASSCPTMIALSDAWDAPRSSINVG